jgi:hypothetical protein
MIRLSDFQFKLMANMFDNVKKGIETQSLKAIVKLECDHSLDCMHCANQRLIEQLDGLNKLVSKFARNTVFTKTYVSLIAFTEACEKLNIHYEVHNELFEKTDKIKRKSIEIRLVHFALDSQGGVKGNEYVTFKTSVFKRSNIGLGTGIPYLADNWVLNPDMFKIESTDLFESEQLTEEMHQENCDFKGTMDFDNCDCSDYAELYCSTAEMDYDFWWMELDHNLEMIFEQLPEATFEFEKESNDRIWSIGGRELYNIDLAERDKEYLEDVQFENGLNRNKD